MIESPAALAGLIAILALINYALGRLVARAHARRSANGRTDPRRLLLPFGGAAVAMLGAFALSGQSREILSGGWFVMQLTNVGLSVADLLGTPGSQRVDSAGQIRDSPASSYRRVAARLVG